ncbi:MAG: hypothetical protein ACRD1T_22605, partial [Acidimicrobiia bacterium]
MAADLRDLMHEAAANPRRPLDIDSALRRGRYLRRRVRVALGLAGTVAAITLAVIAPGMIR